MKQPASPTGEMTMQAKTLLGLRNRKDHLNDELSTVNGKITQVENELGNEMILNQVKSFQINTGQKFSVVQKLYPRIIEAARKTFFTWLRRRRMGDVIKEDINHNTLKKLAQEREEFLKEKFAGKKGGVNAVTDEWEGMVDFHMEIGVSIRNRKGG